MSEENWQERERERVFLFIYSLFFYEIKYRTSEEDDSVSTGLQKTFGLDGEPGFFVYQTTGLIEPTYGGQADPFQSFLDLADGEPSFVS